MSAVDTLIDVWDNDTFDAELRGDLDCHADLIRDYVMTSRRQQLEREASDRRMPYRGNPYAGEFLAVTEHVMGLMEQRTIRAWHYTRMTDAEIEVLHRDGIRLSTLDGFRARLNAQVAAGNFSQDIADRLFADSPFQGDQLGSRSNKFWMVSHPIDVKDSGVELLLESWGGEAAYFWQRDEALQQMLKSVGRPRVLEIAMPLRNSHHGYSAAEAVVATYGRTLGCNPDKRVFDLYAHQALGSEHLLAVHSEGDASYSSLGRGYPDRYVNVNLTRWSGS